MRCQQRLGRERGKGVFILGCEGPNEHETQNGSDLKQRMEGRLTLARIGLLDSKEFVMMSGAACVGGSVAERPVF